MSICVIRSVQSYVYGHFNVVMSVKMMFLSDFPDVSSDSV